MEFDGFVDYKVAAHGPARHRRLRHPARGPLEPRKAPQYMMGLGFKGGLRPATFDWAWDQKKNQDALWLGDGQRRDAGRPAGRELFAAAQYEFLSLQAAQPCRRPGGTTARAGSTVQARRGDGRRQGPRRRHERRAPARARSGPARRSTSTSPCSSRPFKPLDPAAHFRERYYHAFKPLDEVAATGANIINVHHANAINPYINYPFLRARRDEGLHRRRPRAAASRSRSTTPIRELSNRAPELFALRSLGHEIFSPGPGGGYSWLQEHLGGDYIAAWFVPELKDAAVINSGMSRWHNYYIEGLDWLARNVGIDGLYLDDVAFDRTTMKRVRKVLDRQPAGRPHRPPLAPTSTTSRDGFASSANLYLEHFPFLNRLWFGEYFDYNGSGPDYWLVEMSGIPFGLMGEMLQDGGNPWRGMVFGMTARLPWAGDPRPLWKVWDEFGIDGERDDRLVGRDEPGQDGEPRCPGDAAMSGATRAGTGADRPGQLGQGAGRRPPHDRLEEARPRPEEGRACAPRPSRSSRTRRSSSRATRSASSPERAGCSSSVKSGTQYSFPNSFWASQRGGGSNHPEKFGNEYCVPLFLPISRPRPTAPASGNA